MLGESETPIEVDNFLDLQHALVSAVSACHHALCFYNSQPIFPDLQNAHTQHAIKRGINKSLT